MAKKNICIDFDDVIVRTAESILNNIGLFFNEVYSIEQIKEYDISKCLGINNELEQDAIDITLENIDLRLEKDADKVIKWLSQFYNIHIVTSRSEWYLYYVYEILRNNNMFQYIKDIHSSVTKYELFIDLDTEVFIDDNPEYINKPIGIQGLVFDKPWNRNISNSGYIQRVHNWHEIKDYFMIKLGE